MFEKLFGKIKKKAQVDANVIPDPEQLGGRPNLETLGLSKNAWIPLLLDPDEMGIRTIDELYQRMIALWAVVGTAKTGESYFLEYMETNGFVDWLSPMEKTFLYSDPKTERDEIQFSWQSECLHFLAWCGCLFDNLEIPRGHSQLGDWFDLFPADLDDVGRLKDALKIRDKQELLYWSDDLMHIHWNVREANIKGQIVPSGIDGEVIQEWHYAINWMVYFIDDEVLEWDDVTTDT
jgi:hypothetical protein